MRHLLLFSIISLCTVIPASVAWSQQEKILELQKKIEEEKKEINQLSEKEKHITLNLSQIISKLKLIKLKIQEAEKNKKKLENELRALYLENEKIEKQLIEKKNELEKRLIIWHKTYLVKKESAFSDFNESLLFENFMRNIFNYDKRLIENLVESKNRLLKNMEAINRKKGEIVKAETELKSNKAEQELLNARQRDLLKITKKEKDTHTRNLRSAEKALRRLELLIKKAEEAPEYAGKGLSKKILPYPVKGEIVGHFGVEEGTVKGSKFTRKGVEISANDGAKVRSVDDGKFVYAGWIKGLGNICIISHGRSFYTVYGRLSDITKKKGDEIKQGEIIGAVSKEASFYDFPTLYFEIREKENPVNPETWLR